MENRESKISPFNIANVITTIRLIIAPIFIALYIYVYMYGNHIESLMWTVAILYMVGAASDKLDGYLARKYDIVTNYGKIVDPIADKVLVLGAFVCLSLTASLPWVFTIIVALREFAVTVLRAVMIKDAVIPASQYGKWKTVSQMFLIFLGVFPFWLIIYNNNFYYYLNIVYTVTMWIALFMTIFSFIDYVYKARKIKKKPRHGK